jgi:hypothetical protein
VAKGLSAISSTTKLLTNLARFCLRHRFAISKHPVFQNETALLSARAISKHPEFRDETASKPLARDWLAFAISMHPELRNETAAKLLLV